MISKIICFLTLLIFSFNPFFEKKEDNKKKVLSKKDFYKTIIIGKDDIIDLVFENSKGLDEEFLLAIINQESGFNHLAVNKNRNGTYDKGLFQLNSQYFKINFFDKKENIITGINHFDWCLQQTDSLKTAILIYHLGSYNVLVKKKKNNKYLNDIINFAVNLKLMYKDYLYNNEVFL